MVEFDEIEKPLILDSGNANVFFVANNFLSPLFFAFTLIMCIRICYFLNKREFTSTKKNVHLFSSIMMSISMIVFIISSFYLSNLLLNIDIYNDYQNIIINGGTKYTSFISSILLVCYWIYKWLYNASFALLLFHGNASKMRISLGLSFTIVIWILCIAEIIVTHSNIKDSHDIGYFNEYGIFIINIFKQKSTLEKIFNIICIGIDLGWLLFLIVSHIFIIITDDPKYINNFIGLFLSSLFNWTYIILSNTYSFSSNHIDILYGLYIMVYFANNIGLFIVFSENYKLFNTFCKPCNKLLTCCCGKYNKGYNSVPPPDTAATTTEAQSEVNVSYQEQ